MRRADRLFQIVQHLRGGRLVTAQMLGGRLEVSERTIYRDIADLQSTGVPIDGEGGALRVLDGLTARRIFVHINNTNPIQIAGSAERAKVEAAGWQVAEDGLEIAL